VLLVFVVSLAARLDKIDLYSTTDEAYWIQRSIRFGAALARGDLASTFRAGHPGVTVMWVGLLGIGPERLAPFLPERFTSLENLEDARGYLEAFGAARRAMVLVTSVLVAAAVGLAWRLLGPGPALAGGAILTLDPYVIGMTRILHVDALLAPLMTVSALAGLLSWTRSAGWPYLVISAVTGGLALLTKAPSGYLPIFFGLVCLVGLLRGRRAPVSGRQAFVAVRALLIWGLIAAGVYVLLFPSLWVAPWHTLRLLLQFLSDIGLQPHNGNFFLGRPVLADPGPFYYLVAVPLRLSPLVALGLGLLVLPSAPGEPRATARWLLVYALLFVTLMTLASKKFDRYMLPAQVMLDLLAGVGLWRAGALASGWRSGKPHPRPLPIAMERGADSTSPPLHRSGEGVGGWGLPVILVAGVAAVQLALLLAVRPYPITYYNPLAGGPERAQQLIMVGWGEGLEQVADWLNQQPNADRLQVVSSYNHVLRPRFVGTTISIAPYLRPAPGQSPPDPEYLVLYLNAFQRRQISPETRQVDTLGAPVFTATINGLPYARVYQLREPGTRTGPRPPVPLPALNDSESEEN